MRKGTSRQRVARIAIAAAAAVVAAAAVLGGVVALNAEIVWI